MLVRLLGLVLTASLPSLVGCGLYYWTWIYVIARWKGYQIRQEVLLLDNGANSHRLVKVPIRELEEWDLAHDVAGNALSQTPSEEGRDIHKVHDSADPEK